MTSPVPLASSLRLILYWLLSAGGLVFLAGAPALGQASYVGTVGTAPIELAVDSYGEGTLAGVYLYSKFGTPIVLSGQLRHGVLTLTEKDAHGKPSARLTFRAFSGAARSLTGTWQSLAASQQLPIALTQRFVVPQGEETAGAKHELLQAAALKNSYFKTVIAQEKDNSYPGVIGLQIWEKKTNKLRQQFTVDCQLRGLYSVSVADYNFDGLLDFAVFESSYVGPNTSSLYFLYDPASKRFVESDFSGVSLEFDAKRQRVLERNSCCAGSSVTTAEYKVMRNHLVPLARHCYRWDYKKKQLVERPLGACQ